MTLRNSPRVALVTGAAAGLGKAFAERLAQDGNDLILVDVCDTDITAELVQQHGCTALQVRCDVTDEAQVTDLVATARARFESVDILVSNAGIYPKADIAELTLAEWKRVVAVNVEGAFLITRAFLPPFPMWPAFPALEYYGGSAPSQPGRPTAGPAPRPALAARSPRAAPGRFPCSLTDRSTK